MAKLTVGETMPDFTFDTIYEKGLTIGEVVKRASGKTALVFLRYYGCTLCQYDIHLFKESYEKISAGGGQLLVVLQSDPAKLAGQMEKGDLPFDVICDPEQKLYKQFEIAPVTAKEEMIDDATRAKAAQARAAGFSHGDYEGEELQRPAAFVLDKDLTLTYVRYGTVLRDVPTPEELAALLA